MKTRPSSFKGVGRYAYSLGGESKALRDAKHAYQLGDPSKLIAWLADRGWEREPTGPRGGIRRRIM